MEGKLRLIVALVALAIVVGGAFAFFPIINGSLAPWYGPVVAEDEVQLALWVDGNLPHGTLFAADLFACEMLTATARVVCSVGGAWELADRANQRFFDNEKAFIAESPREAWDIFREYGVKYAFTSSRKGFYGYGYKDAPLEKFADGNYFEFVRAVGSARVYRVKEKVSGEEVSRMSVS